MLIQQSKTYQFVFQIVALQVMIGFIIASIWFYTNHHPVDALSALSGGLICACASVYFAWRMFGTGEEFNPKKIIQRFYRAENAKFIFIIVTFFLVIRFLPINIIPFLVGYLISQLANWLVLLNKRFL